MRQRGNITREGRLARFVANLHGSREDQDMSPLKHLATAALAVCAITAAAADLPPGTGWYSIPNTRLRTVCAADNGFPSVSGASGCPAITLAWSSGVFDSTRNRMIVWGGGHNDYYGNELYALPLDTLIPERLTNPGLPVASSGSCVDAIAGGTQPNSRHTYDGIEYIASADRMFVFGGSLACNAGNFGSDTWTFDFASKQWRRMQPSGPIPVGDAGMTTAYDPVSGLIYLHDRRNLYSYDVNADAYTRLTPSGAALGYHMGATIDPQRRRFVLIGWDSAAGAGRVYTINIGPGSTYQLQTLATTGGDAIVNARYPGIEYDPVSNSIVAWSENSGSDVYSLNLDTRQWTRTALTGGPTPVGNGTNGRWRYSVASSVFVLVNSVDANIYALRLPADRGSIKVPVAPANVSVQ